MRLYLGLILTSIIMAFATGYMALFVQKTNSATKEDILQINQIKWNFQKSIPPSAMINFNALYHDQERFKLLNPIYSLPSEGVNEEISYFSNENCFSNMEKILTSSNYEKVWLWEEFRCGIRSTLPQSFFREPPYLHPSGLSYSFLAFKSEFPRFHNRNWVIRHLNLFHVQELSHLTREVGKLEGIFKFLEKLDRTSLEDIVSGTGTILSQDYLLARIKYPSMLSVLEYRFYRREDLERFLKDYPFTIHNYRLGKQCFYRDGELCWDYSVRHVFNLVNDGALSLFGLCLVTLVILLRLIFQRMKQQRLEDQRKRLALQVLTHEFRTPVASLLLQVEDMGRNFEKLPPEAQENFMRINSDVHRLKRLTDMSRNYLRSQNNNKLIDFNLEELPSLNDFVEDVIQEFAESRENELDRDQITFVPLEQDAAIRTDWYWLRICLQNLLNNAFDHGKPPVDVSLRLTNDQIAIKVVDSGSCQFKNLDEITAEFTKGTQSIGTGLGLNIVRKVIESLKGQLKFERGPTSFTISLPRQTQS